MQTVVWVSTAGRDKATSDRQTFLKLLPPSQIPSSLCTQIESSWLSFWLWTLLTGSLTHTSARMHSPRGFSYSSWGFFKQKKATLRRYQSMAVCAGVSVIVPLSLALGGWDSALLPAWRQPVETFPHGVRSNCVTTFTMGILYNSTVP